MIRKVAFFLTMIVLSSFTFRGNETEIVAESGKTITAKDLFHRVPETDIDSTALYIALKGYLNIQNSVDLKRERLIVIDFSKPSTENRFFLINPISGKVIHKSVVAHGKNSGQLYANSFSNKPGSHQSSLGFYRIGETYLGKHGRSLKLDGLEYGINHKARDRAIVIHSAKYANPEFAVGNGYLGRSFGCPSLPEKQYNWIVDEIKEGTLLFIYHPSQYQIEKSKWV